MAERERRNRAFKAVRRSRYYASRVKYSVVCSHYSVCVCQTQTTVFATVLQTIQNATNCQHAIDYGTTAFFMANSLSRHPKVADDIEAIAEHIWSEGYTEAALRFIDASEQTARFVAQYPFGRVYKSGVSKLDAYPIRSRTIPFPNRPSRRPYRIFWRVDEDEVRILYVYASRQSIPNLMARDVRE